MEMDYVSDFLHSSMDSRPRKRPRFAWDFPQSRPKAQSGLYCGQEFGNGMSIKSSGVLSGDLASLFIKGLAQKGYPLWRNDDKDGHYMFALGDNLTSRCNYPESPFKVASFVIV
uniref:Serine/threonine-protein kinase AFC2-like n=1 Tax=Rhizophora mucronata TaxID=61149 RepID=A0A2P2LIX3_RHIMU